MSAFTIAFSVCSGAPASATDARSSLTVPADATLLKALRRLSNSASTRVVIVCTGVPTLLYRYEFFHTCRTSASMSSTVLYSPRSCGSHTTD